jgi:thiol-disulfide isomerase/thioredoxin
MPVPPPLGQKVLLPTLAWISERVWSPAQLEGRITVVYWWASWCPFCREQTPQMQALWERHAQQGIQVLGISVDRKPETARAYLKQGGYNFACAWYDEALTRVFARPGMIPSVAVLNRQARVVQSERGQMFPEDVAALSRWLSQP